MENAIEVHNLSKIYQLGSISTNTFYGDLSRWWSKIIGIDDPYEKINLTSNKSHENKFFHALNDINFSIPRGEIVGIIGPNGAGKSTLLKILSRVTAPSTGIVKINGRIASLLEVGTGFHPELTGRENIFLNGSIMGMSYKEVKGRFDEIVDFSGVEKYIDTPVKRYSSGMFVRLAFAVAAHLEPEILIVDEVLAVGDADFQNKALGKMSEVSQGYGRTVLFVSHNMASISNLCKECILLNNGTFVEKNSADTVINNYLNSLNTTIRNTPLRERTDRRGNGHVKLIDFRFENENQQKQLVLVSGSTVILCFEYVCDEPLSVKDIDIGFSFHKNNGDMLSVTYSSYFNQNYHSAEKKGVFRFQIDKLPLSKGKYKINARIVTNGIESDWLNEFLVEFFVESGDFYQSGRSGFGGNAPILINGTWS